MLNNEMPKACMRCYNEEDKGITSKRIEETKNYPEFDKISKRAQLTAEDGNVDLDPVLLSCVLVMFAMCVVLLAIPASSAGGYPIIKKFTKGWTSLMKAIRG